MCYTFVVQTTDSFLHLLKNYLSRHCEKQVVLRIFFDVLITYAVVPGNVTFYYGDCEWQGPIPDNVKPQTVLFSMEVLFPAVIFLFFLLPPRIITTLVGYAVHVAAIRCQFYRQAMAYKEVKPQPFVRVVAPMLTRVM